MNDIDDALRRYAAATPDLDPRAGLAERLRRHERRRRAAVAGVACLAALVAGTGVAALSAERTTAGLTATDPTPMPALSPTPTPTPTPSPTPTETPDPTPAEPTPTADPTSAQPQPIPTGSASGKHGLKATASLVPGTAAAATGVTLRIRATDDDGRRVGLARLDWGDGSGLSWGPLSEACALPPTPYPTTRPKEPGRYSEDLRHSWRHDGTYAVVVVVSSSTGCAYPPGADESAEIRLRIVVTDGEVVSNGPAEPQVENDLDVRQEEYDDENLEWRVEGGVRDTDGYVASATIDWGDGSALRVVRNEAPCDDGDGRHFPDSYLGIWQGHDYEPGTYTITVTWTTAGCDGKDRQSVAVTARVVDDD